jgi:hypothetical protein
VAGERDGHGRRARRRVERQRAPVAPMAGWVVLALVVTAAILLVGGVEGRTVAWLLLAGAVVGGVLVVAAVVSPPLSMPDEPDTTAGTRDPDGGGTGPGST